MSSFIAWLVAFPTAIILFFSPTPVVPQPQPIQITSGASSTPTAVEVRSTETKVVKSSTDTVVKVHEIPARDVPISIPPTSVVIQPPAESDPTPNTTTPVQEPSVVQTVPPAQTEPVFSNWKLTVPDRIPANQLFTATGSFYVDRPVKISWVYGPAEFSKSITVNGVAYAPKPNVGYQFTGGSANEEVLVQGQVTIVGEWYRGCPIGTHGCSETLTFGVYASGQSYTNEIPVTVWNEL